MSVPFDFATENDAELVREMLRGDADAFQRFFDVAYPSLFRFALVRLGFDRDAAGEVAQAAICKAIRRLETYRGEAALLTWLFTFCRRELYASSQRRGRRVQVELIEEVPEIRAALESLGSSSFEDLDTSLDRTKMSSFVHRVMSQLPPHYADALEWKYIDELPVQQVAERLGVGTKAAESLLTRARQAFRDAFHTLAPSWLETGQQG